MRIRVTLRPGAGRRRPSRTGGEGSIGAALRQQGGRVEVARQVTQIMGQIRRTLKPAQVSWRTSTLSELRGFRTRALGADGEEATVTEESVADLRSHVDERHKSRCDNRTHYSGDTSLHVGQIGCKESEHLSQRRNS